MLQANILTRLEGPKKVGEFGESSELGESGNFGDILSRLSTKYCERIY